MDFRLEFNKIKNTSREEYVIGLDTDYIKYTGSSVGESRPIMVKHKKTGKEKQFKNITEFRGRSTKTLGGWLAERNEVLIKGGKTPQQVSDFEITQQQIPEDLNNVLHTTKLMLLGVQETFGSNRIKFYMGEGEPFRVGLSTLQEYKGNRKDLLKPVHFDAVVQYIKDNYPVEVIKGIEADDKLVMESYANPELVIVGVDKDYRGQPCKFFDMNNPDEGIINGDCFGKLVRNVKVKYSGKGKKYLAWQALSGGLEGDLQELSLNTYSQKEAAELVKGPRSEKSLIKKIPELSELFEHPSVQTEPYGSLKIDKSIKILGYGRLFLYWQILAGDSSDNYKASCKSHMSLGDTGAYNLLVDCKTDKEALDVLIKTFQEMYPSSSQHIQPHQLDIFIPINWYYVLNEMFQMARMLRWEGDFMSFAEWYKIYMGEDYE